MSRSSISSHSSDSSIFVSVGSSSSGGDGAPTGGNAGVLTAPSVDTIVLAAQRFAQAAPAVDPPRTPDQERLAAQFAGAPLAGLADFSVLEGLDAGDAQRFAEGVVDVIVRACDAIGSAGQAAPQQGAKAQTDDRSPGALPVTPTFSSFGRPARAPGRFSAAVGFSSFVHTMPEAARRGPVKLPELTWDEQFLLKLYQEDIDRIRARIGPPTMWAQAKAQIVAGWIASYGGFSLLTFIAKLAGLLGVAEPQHFLLIGGALIGNIGELRAARYRAMNPGYSGADQAAYQGRDTLRDRGAHLLCELEGARGNNPVRAREIEDELRKLQVDVQKLCVDCLRREHGFALGWKKPGDNHDVPGPFKSSVTLVADPRRGHVVGVKHGSAQVMLCSIEPGSTPQSPKLRWFDGTVTDVSREPVPEQYRERFDALEEALMHMAWWRSLWTDEVPLNSLNLHYVVTGAMSPVVQNMLPCAVGKGADLAMAVYATTQATCGVLLWQNVMRWALSGANASPGMNGELKRAEHDKAATELRIWRAHVAAVRGACAAIDAAVLDLRKQVEQASGPLRKAERQAELDAHLFTQNQLREIKRLCVKKARRVGEAEKLLRRQNEVIQTGWGISLKDHWVKQPLTGLARLGAYFIPFFNYAEVWLRFVQLPLRPRVAAPLPESCDAAHANLTGAPAGAVPAPEANATTAAAHGFDYAAWGPYMAAGSVYGFVIGIPYTFRNLLLVPTFRRGMGNVIGKMRAENHRRQANPHLDRQRFSRIIGYLSRLKCCGGTDDEYVGAEDANPQQDAFEEAPSSGTEPSSSDTGGTSSSSADETGMRSASQPALRRRGTRVAATQVPHYARNLDEDEPEDEKVRLPRHGHDNDDSEDSARNDDDNDNESLI